MNIHAHLPRAFELGLVIAIILIALVARGFIHDSAGPDLSGAHSLGVGISPAPSTGAAPLETVPPDVQAQLDALSPGTVIVPCNSSEARLPEGIDTSGSLAYLALHPGWRFLLHGYCADNPTA